MNKACQMARLLILLRQELASRQTQESRYHWPSQARPNQCLPEGAWKVWLILAGRGFGKTRTGAETVRLWATSGQYKRICLLGHTVEDVRKVMVEGESGLLAVSSPAEGVRYEPANRKLIWPNGATAWIYSAESYQQLRGPQFDAAWVDEMAKFTYAEEAWDQLNFCLRLGPCPRVIITTTPRPVPVLKALMQRPDTVVTRGSTFDNQENLSPHYLDSLRQHYMGTRLGAQEIEGHLLETTEGALWTPEMFVRSPTVPPLTRIVVALDPAVTTGQHSDETGIIVAGRDADGYGYVLEDLSGQYTPTQWVNKAAEAFHRHKADRLVAEVNNGGDMVEQLVHTLHPDIAYRAVRATRGKYTRAEPIAALYEQKRIFHTQRFSQLEDQLLTYTPQATKSPDRMDALVWALTELLCTPEPARPKVWKVDYSKG